MSNINFFLSAIRIFAIQSAQMRFISANERSPRKRLALKHWLKCQRIVLYSRLSKLEQRSVLHSVFIIQRSRGAHSAMRRSDSRQIRYLDMESLVRAGRNAQNAEAYLSHLYVSACGTSRCVASRANTFL